MTIECSVQSKATSVYIRTEFVNVMLVTLTLSSRLTPCFIKEGKIYNKLQRLPKRMVHSFFSWTRIIGRVSTHPATEPRLVDWGTGDCPNRLVPTLSLLRPPNYDKPQSSPRNCTSKKDRPIHMKILQGIALLFLWSCFFKGCERSSSNKNGSRT